MKSVLLLSCALIGLANCRAAEETNFLQKVVNLGLPKLGSQIPTYYSEGGKARAEKIETGVADMTAFYRERLGIRQEVNIAVLNSNEWAKIVPAPYGLPCIYGTPPVIFMPATTGGFAVQLMMARKEAIPPDLLRSYLATNHVTFEMAAQEFVDAIAFHEVGHGLCGSYRIDPKCNWLNEFLASYFEYAYIAERRPESRRVFELLGRPSHVRPKNVTLADFERLYFGVDDYGWYQGMFESQVQKLYAQKGLDFLKEVGRNFPAGTEKSNRVSLEHVLERLEKIAPGFQDWAKGFN